MAIVTVNVSLLKQPPDFTDEQLLQLLEMLPSGLPRVSEYRQYLVIMLRPDTPEEFIKWTQMAVLAMGDPEGSA